MLTPILTAILLGFSAIPIRGIIVAILGWLYGSKESLSEVPRDLFALALIAVALVALLL